MPHVSTSSRAPVSLVYPHCARRGGRRAWHTGVPCPPSPGDTGAGVSSQPRTPTQGSLEKGLKPGPEQLGLEARREDPRRWGGPEDRPGAWSGHMEHSVATSWLRRDPGWEGPRPASGAPLHCPLPTRCPSQARPYVAPARSQPAPGADGELTFPEALQMPTGRQKTYPWTTAHPRPSHRGSPEQGAQGKQRGWSPAPQVGRGRQVRLGGQCPAVGAASRKGHF